MRQNVEESTLNAEKRGTFIKETKQAEAAVARFRNLHFIKIILLWKLDLISKKIAPVAAAAAGLTTGHKIAMQTA